MPIIRIICVLIIFVLGGTYVRVEGLLVSVRIHQRKDSRGDRDEEEGIRK